MNKMEIGKRVFSIHHSDGKAKPEHYFLEKTGIVSRLLVNEKHNYKVVQIENTLFAQNKSIFDNSEDMFLKPSKDGFCYYMAEFPSIDEYKEGDFYKVPSKILKDHMKTYQSPWDK